MGLMHKYRRRNFAIEEQQRIDQENQINDLRRKRREEGFIKSESGIEFEIFNSEEPEEGIEFEINSDEPTAKDLEDFINLYRTKAVEATIPIQEVAEIKVEKESPKKKPVVVTKKKPKGKK